MGVRDEIVQGIDVFDNFLRPNISLNDDVLNGDWIKREDEEEVIGSTNNDTIFMVNNKY